ncbi:MAG TPA: ABC transporter ATP-binding protein [Thermoanaerobaculaceae bacterium]|nr:ABC transporter ATP-binding protein [Thermoanaerobaculaceae bacterium]
MDEPSTVVSVRRLAKDFRHWGRRLRALDAVDLEVRRGEVFGLLGANGAGKTTLIKILLGLTRPTEGEARVRGRDPRVASSRTRIGYLPEGHRFPGYLTGAATLRLFGRLAGLPEGTLDRRTPELLELVGLGDRARDRVGRYSKGMTQRLGLACALLDDPNVLFLDEPTDGVDPVGRRQIRDILLAIRATGATIFINSHLLSEVERTCDRVAILHHGRVIREGTVEGLTRPTQRFRLHLAAGELPATERLRAIGAAVVTSNGALEVEVPDLETLNRLVDTLRAERLLIAEISPLRAALEDVFVEVVGEEDRATDPEGQAAAGGPQASGPKPEAWSGGGE